MNHDILCACGSLNINVAYPFLIKANEIVVVLLMK